MTQKQSFETNLKELEEVVKKLEEKEISLEEMLTLYEKGIRLTKECTVALDEAEQKITILMKNRETDELQEEPFGTMGE